MPGKCLLCHSEKLQKHEISVQPQGIYWQCVECEYIFRDPDERLPAREERRRYELHENGDSPGYRRFLGPVVEAVLRHRPPPTTGRGLDYGCGPTAFLAHLFAEKGVELRGYDPIFFPDPAVFHARYDFVTSTEVFEHMFQPRQEIGRIHEVLQPGGLLAVKTSLTPALEIFKTWGYRRDETHVGFFARKSFRHIAHEWNFDLLEELENLWILRKKS